MTALRAMLGAMVLEAIDMNKSFVDTHDGEVVSISGTKLVMTGSQGKKEQTCNLTASGGMLPPTCG